ncbi:ATP-grasp domain-containing protein [Proteobacteria bacterium 005FR1]|nr:ATP-grasp domain-containing protein [Proteobacteria bacterium 005FR1]
MSDKRRPNVLVLDANQRSALAVTRSLGSSGEVNVITADSSAESLAGCSRYSIRNLTCPSPETHASEFLDWTERAVSQHAIDAVFPVTEISSQLLLMNKQRLGDCHLPFADYDTVMSLADKGRLLKTAETASVPVPPYQLFNSASEVNLEQMEEFPLVVKPCLSRIWREDSWTSTSVRIAESRDDLARILRETDYLQHDPFMIQSFIPGHGAGIFALFNHGEPVAYFSHRRVREKPPRGGVSVLSESVETDPAMKAYAEALLRSVRWHGVAMVEFRVSNDGLPYLMEVNTRFWGSLQLAIDSGVDFPYLLWRLGSSDAMPLDAKDVREAPYRTGQRLRWLLGDLDSLYLTLKDGTFEGREKWRRVIDFCTPRLRNCRHEVNRFGDFSPTWFELRRYVRDLIG